VGLGLFSIRQDLLVSLSGGPLSVGAMPGEVALLSAAGPRFCPAPVWN
jgi:hypothetical protein